MTLADIRHGQIATIASLASVGREKMRLRELGLGEGQAVTVVANSDPMICMIAGSRFGLARRLASCIQVAIGA